MLFGILVVLLLAAIFVGAIVYQSKKNKAAAQWPAVQGRIVQSEVFRSHNDDGPTDEPLITYEYVAGGKTYRSRRVKFSFKPQTQPTLKKYPMGAVVPVYYDPSNPSEAVLER